MIKIEKVRTYSIFTGKTRQADREPRLAFLTLVERFAKPEYFFQRGTPLT
jgi:hypothetical protein